MHLVKISSVQRLVEVDQHRPSTGLTGLSSEIRGGKDVPGRPDDQAEVTVRETVDPVVYPRHAEWRFPEPYDVRPHPGRGGAASASDHMTFMQVIFSHAFLAPSACFTSQ